MKLITKVTSDQIENWVDLKEGEYLFLSSYSTKELCGIIFKCPGCSEPLSVTTKTHKEEPGWAINFETLTATPSILHKRNGHGCGWHGYLTNGELTGQIE